MKNTLTFFPLVICFFLLLGYNFMSAQWSAPTQAPPNGNVSSPVNVGSTTQAKAGNFMANIMAAATSTWSPRYCDELGQNCWDPASSTPGGGSQSGTYGKWRDMLALRTQNTWYQNPSANPLAISYRGGDNTFAYVSPTGSDADRVTVGSHAADSGQYNPGFFIVPPGHYYKWVGGINLVAEMVLGVDDINYATMYYWLPGTWGACNAPNRSCGNSYGTQTRTVTCVDGNGQPVLASNCSALTPPASSQSCVVNFGVCSSN